MSVGERGSMGERESECGRESGQFVSVGEREGE